MNNLDKYIPTKTSAFGCNLNNEMIICSQILYTAGNHFSPCNHQQYVDLECDNTVLNG